MSDVSDATGDEEVVDGLPVLARRRTLDIRRPALVAPRQAAALAATGFMAGAAMTAVLSRRRSRVRLGRRARRKGSPAIGEILATNSFLVDVHLVKRR